MRNSIGQLKKGPLLSYCQTQKQPPTSSLGMTAEDSSGTPKNSSAGGTSKN
jgi:hypothetical protein